MHVRIISSDTFRRVYCAEKKPIGSKRWLKTWRNWNLQPHNIASLYNTSLFAKLQFYLIKLFTNEQCRNRRLLWSSDSKQPKTRTLNKAVKRQTWIKLRFNPAALLDTRKAVKQLQRPLAPTGQKKWDVVGASIKSIPTKYHSLGSTFTGCKTSQAFTSGTFLWHRSQRVI